MTLAADLHIHTAFSDSTLLPEEAVREAHAAGLSCFAITDHDTLAGVEPTRKAAQEYALEIISAVELSSEIQGKDVHVLGYFMDGNNALFKNHLKKIQDVRRERLKSMIEKFNTLGQGHLTWDEVKAHVQGSSAGRPHLAMAMKEKGIVATVAQAFEKYIGEDSPAYVKRFNISPFEAIDLIKKAGGVSVLAHPMVTSKDELIPSFVEAGLNGIEVYYPNYSGNTIRHYEGIAKKHNLAVTGGSDAHGKAKTNTYIGKIKIPYELVVKLKNLLP